MTQLTLRGFDGDVEKAIRTLAKREGCSLNLAALMLLRRGAGLERGKSNVNPNAIGASYDDLIGTWSKKEADAFDRAVSDFSMIDEDMWK
jgi:hypothetical protein